MFRPETAVATVPAIARPAPVRHPPRRYPLVRRNPRRFARGIRRVHALRSEPAPSANSDMRFFVHSFGATFLFVSLLIA